MISSVRFKAWRNPMMHSLLLLGAVVMSFGAAPSATAATLRLGDLQFSESDGDFRITGGRRSSEFYTIEQEVYGPDVNLLMSIRGFKSLFEDGYVGIRVRSIVKNLTGTPWTFFDHELRQRRDRRSPEEDGLSFAQGYQSIRPFRSDRFSRVDEETDVRDYINFSRGVVNPGETVTFVYAITDNSPDDRFYLLQRPNFRPGGVGFVNTPQPQPSVRPSPVAPTRPTPVPSPSPAPITRPSPVPTPIVSPIVTLPLPILPNDPPVQRPPDNTAAVPEPATLLGGLTAAVGGLWLRRRQKGEQERE
jgi:hypothetical protein